jgi:hypothetical protein
MQPPRVRLAATATTAGAVKASLPRSARELAFRVRLVIWSWDDPGVEPVT